MTFAATQPQSHASGLLRWNGSSTSREQRCGHQLRLDLQFAGVPLAASLHGPQAVQLLVDGRYAAIEKPFILSWARRGTPLRIALLVTLGVLLLILLPVFEAQAY